MKKMISIIGDGDLKVTVDSLGAEAISVVYRGEERSWQNENGAWSGHAPVLFPYCGNCRVTVDGVSYKRAAHGFARKTEFFLADKSDNSVAYTLKSSAATKEYYPYDFEFTVKYTASGNTLTVDYTVTNPNDGSLPFSCGGHESFALKEDIDHYCIKFERKEHLLHRYHDGEGLLSGKTRDWGVTDCFKLPADFLTDGETLIFSGIKSRSVALCDGSGNTLAVSEFPDFENLLLWRPHGGKVICIEPWGNLPTTDEFSRLAAFTVQPHNSLTVSRKIKYL